MNDGHRAALAAEATCFLLINDRVILRATAPPDAEYAMFEIGEIELRASEPGRVREHGYQTTGERARARLATLGITASVARDLTIAMQPLVADAYARGTAARRVARYLGPLELFQADGFDAATHSYRGVFLDLAALARDIELEHAGATLQALYLATVLESEANEAKVLLSTDACTKSGKPGARTYRRPTFTDPPRLLNALGELAHKRPTPHVAETLPRQDVIAFLRARADTATDEDTRALYKSLEGSVALRDLPERGPLAAPDLWAIEMRIDGGDLHGLVAAIDEAERRHGRTPGTTYLRARVALALRLEPAKLIAERVSSLALSMTSFAELALLAAEAWLDAGDPRRAMPYARDLVDAPGIDEGLLLRAQRIFARAIGAAPARKETLADGWASSPQPSRPPAPETAPPVALWLEPPTESELAYGLDLSAVEPPAGVTRDFSRPASLSPPAPPSPPRPTRRPRPFGVTVETRPPPSFDPRAEPDSPPRRESALPAGSPFMVGASLPPYRHEDPPPLLRPAPLFSKLADAKDELAEHLSLPPGLGGELRAEGALPTSTLEARAQFTLLARELGLDYRLKRGIDLRADMSGIEAMQSVLLESFPDRTVTNAGEAYELRRHGALLSEILARQLDAEWLDISPNELGYWVMIVPPDTRVWPFGRVARLVAMGHKERDLVSYFLELKARARSG